MKKTLVFYALCSFSLGFSQCTISGADEIQVGERVNYTAEISADDASNIYEWVYLDQKLIPEGSLNEKSLTVKGSDLGKSMLTLKVKSGSGNVKCHKTVNVIAPTTNLSPNSSSCDLKVDAFIEKRISNNTVVFEPVTSETQYSYTWIVTYRNGKKESSGNKAGKFNYSNQNVIDQVQLEIKEGYCSKKVSKVYDTNFWYFF
ncbi:hypothetical protein [Chryseobacterium sp. MP_3.2]|uniref:hypothetical protein n=1 Tax=Chryseobacterium sp. MP_3.2 TaxID=3071712 RepID=UPI002E09E3C6|nr:hypothetical protein [Chryseobacterium sp. MP_3.2]